MKVYNPSNLAMGFKHFQEGNGIESTEAGDKSEDDMDYVSKIDLG